MNMIVSKLFSNVDANVYGILDGASIKKNIPLLLEAYGLQYVCLYRGELELDLEMRAPYLVKLTPHSEFLKLWLDEGWGKHWGIFVVSYANLKTMRQFLRRFLTVRKPDGKIVYFRFYDPRVLNKVIPVFNREQLTEFFNEIPLTYMCEHEYKKLVSFNYKDHKLVIKGSSPSFSFLN